MTGDHTVCLIALTGCGAGIMGLAGFTGWLIKDMRDNEKAQIKVDVEQTAAMNDLAKQSERVEAAMSSLSGLVAKSQTISAGGNSVSTT